MIVLSLLACEGPAHPVRGGGGLPSAGNHVEASFVQTGDVPTDPAELDPWVDPGTWIEPPVFAAGSDVTVHYAGALANPTLRFGFDGWIEVPDLDQEREVDAHGQELWYTDAPMTAAGDGTWTLTLTPPPAVSAMHVEFVAGETVDDHEGWQWHASAEFPYVGPYLSWDDAVGPLDGIVVSWETSTPSLGVVEYGTTEALGSFAVGAEPDTLHHVPLVGLPQGTTVYYRVYDNAGHVSDVHEFLTLAEGEDSFRFLVAADMQDNNSSTDRWPEVADAIVETSPDARFVLVPGDLASTNRPGHWWRYFEGGRELFASVPMMPVPGNHDTRAIDEDADLRVFERWFALPGAEDHYHFDYGSVRLLGFDTEMDAEMLYGGDQYLEAEAVLATEDPGWVFGYQHYAPYTVNKIPPNGELDLQTITGLFPGRLDWLFCAHNHNAERYQPLAADGSLAPSGRYGRGADDGVGYLVVPSAGDHPWEFVLTEEEDTDGLLDKVAWPAIDPEAGLQDGQHGWMQVDVSPGQLHLTTWHVGDAEAPQPPYVADEVVQAR